MATGAVNETVYVAVGEQDGESMMTLLWALEHLRSQGPFCILHIHVPCATGSSEELRRKNMVRNLDDYVNMCNQAEVPAEKQWIESGETEKGIVEFIMQHDVRKLVMGAAADDHYTEGMTELKSTKAIFVNQHAHPSCVIWFICREQLIHLRQVNLTMEGTDLISFTQPPARSTGETEQSYLSSSLSSVQLASSSSEIEVALALVPYEGGQGSGSRTEADSLSLPEEDQDLQLVLLRSLERDSDDDLYEKLRRAIADAAKAKQEAVDELVKRRKAESDVIEATHRAEAAEEHYYQEVQRNKELEETLQELRDKLLATELQLEIRDKERDTLKVTLENTLNVNEEILANQGGESSSPNGQQEAVALPNQNDEPPDYFLCPITRDVMEDPHVTADGYTYEEKVIKEWFNGHDTSPMTNLELLHGHLTPNLALRAAIKEWQDNHNNR